MPVPVSARIFQAQSVPVPVGARIFQAPMVPGISARLFPVPDRPCPVPGKTVCSPRSGLAEDAPDAMSIMMGEEECLDPIEDQGKPRSTVRTKGFRNLRGFRSPNNADRNSNLKLGLLAHTRKLLMSPRAWHFFRLNIKFVN